MFTWESTSLNHASIKLFQKMYFNDICNWFLRLIAFNVYEMNVQFNFTEKNQNAKIIFKWYQDGFLSFNASNHTYLQIDSSYAKKSENYIYTVLIYFLRSENTVIAW